ncbi:MAG: response regulator [Propionivibrio sp.]|uniref:response regulator transcription factor n=1 Tax=Propionivibrio sp. TaxID=2212460 RepID=UPI0025F8D6D7|nr:response regulator [Propionivibrio sp.]MBK7355948.1 response regulator [Propionivibrio sp.]MBK8400392.1 response regulator [Propionivibrio sp.]
MLETPARTPVVYVVDDEPSVRDALRLLFQSVGMKVVEFENASAALSGADELDSGCLITDLRMPMMSGIDLIEALRERGCHLPAIVISAHGDVKLAVRALKAGASDFVEKPFNDQDLLDAVNSTINRPPVSGWTQALSGDMAARVAQITSRELAVLKQIVAGQSNKQIARDLDLSPRTVEAHRARVMQKMQAGSVAELVSLALRAGIVMDEELV